MNRKAKNRGNYMYCEKCGYKNLDNVSYCYSCGNSLNNDTNIKLNHNSTSTQNINYTQIEAPKSYFDGGLLQQIGWLILGIIVTIITLGIGFPWAVCMQYNWETKHTIIEGRRLRFNGNAVQLFGKWILWLLLTIITLGVFSFWIPIKIKKWKTKHTFFDNRAIPIYNRAMPMYGQRLPQHK